MNPWCNILNIDVPSLERVRGHREASTYTLLLVALLERGGPMTLDEVATRFEEAGVAPAGVALRSLKRCRPARAPVYRDGDRYCLDPYDDDLNLWMFRLGLRPAKVPMLAVVPVDAEPLPGPDQPLTPSELEEAFRDGYVWNWSALRLALAVLDAHGGRLAGVRVVELLNGLGAHHGLRVEAAKYWRSGAITPAEDGVWVLDPTHPSLRSCREAVRKRVETTRRHKAARPDPVAMEVHRKRWEGERRANADRLGDLRRALLYAAPVKGHGGRPAAVTLIDVGARAATTWIGDEVDGVEAALDDFDLIAGLDVRALLRTLTLDPGVRRLADLSPPQKTVQLNRAGRTLKITTEMLIRGSCGISRPFGDPDALRRYVDRGDETKLRRRTEADAKSLFALYQYGRLHGAVRLRRGFLDEMFRVPWVHRDETTIYGLMRSALEVDGVLEVVMGDAPEWTDPWARVCRCLVVASEGWYRPRLVDAGRRYVDEREVQLARLPAEVSGGPTILMKLDTLVDVSPWDWPEDTGERILELLRDPGASEPDRLLATELAGHQVVLDDILAAELLRILTNPEEPDAIRARAAISLGPALAEADVAGFEGSEFTSIKEPLFVRAKDALQALYHDPGTSHEVRRRVLEASVRTQAGWHEEAVRTAFRSGDPDWRLTAVFCMRFVPGLEAEILESLQSEDLDILYQAVRAVEEQWVVGAWPRIRDLLLAGTSGWALPRRGEDDIEKALVLAAIGAAEVIGPLEAEVILGELLDSDDEDIADAAMDALSFAGAFDADDDLDDDLYDEEDGDAGTTFH